MKKYKEIFYVTLLLLLSYITHQEWFNPNSILISGDWFFWETITLNDFSQNFGTWRGNINFGFPNIQLYLNTWIYPWSVLINNGISGVSAVKINMFLPVAILGFLSPYYLIKYLTKNSDIGFVAALFYGSTTYFLVSQTSHLPIAFVYAVTPLLILLLDAALMKNKLSYWIILSLFFSLGIGYELRIMFLTTLIMIFYTMYFGYLKSFRKYIKNWIISVVIVVLLNLYWILPTLFGGLFYSVGEVAGRGLFGEPLANILRGFTLSHWAWTGGFPDKNFDAQPIKVYFWIIPVLVIASLSYLKNAHWRQILFFLVILLFGIFFVKQSAPPFQGMYSFFREYVPGFVLFRESSKFYFLVAFGYLGVISYLLLSINKYKKKLYLFGLSVVIFISLLNLKPLITKDFDTLFVSRNIPTEYVQLNKYIQDEKDDFRVLWIPTRSRWAAYSGSNPIVSMDSVINKEWSDYVVEEDDGSTGEQIESLIRSKHFEKLISNANIRLVVVPTSENSIEKDIISNYGEDRGLYVNALNESKFLEFKSNLNGLLVYENLDYKPRVSINSEKVLEEKLTYEYISSTRYKINIVNVSSDSLSIYFSEQYHPSWKIYREKFDLIDVQRNREVRNIDHINESNLNTFEISSSIICEQINCDLNEDGTYNASFTIYFKPQSWFYFGSVISISTMVLVFGYLGFYVGKKIYERKNKKNI